MNTPCCIALALLGVAVQAAPTLLEHWPTPETTLTGFSTVELVFSEPVLGVDAEDLVANAVPALRVTAVQPDRFLFEFSPVTSGRVTLEWRDEHQITDATDLRLPFPGEPWFYEIDPAMADREVRITEFLADNQRTLNDEDGDASDWIELHNGGDQPVRLLDWGLSDLADQPFLWRFPEVTLEPDAYLVVFASGKDRTNVTGRLHTNFRLAASGEFLALTNPDATVQSAFAPSFPTQRTDVAYGRVAADPERLGFFTVPTPGALNTVAGSGFAPDVTSSHPAGSFVDPFELTLTTAPVPGVEIRYTRDGTLPGSGSLRYDAPLLLTNTTRIRARAFVPGTDLLPGPPRTLAFTRVSTNLLAFASDLPLLVLNTWSNTISSARNTHVSFELHEPQDGRATLTNTMRFGTRGAAKVRGSSTAGLAKASYAIEWWDEFNQDRNLGILGMPAESEWVLYAPNAFDPVLIHNPFIHQLSRDLGQYSPRTRFVEVFLHRGGLLTSNQYAGVYVLIEKIAFGPERVPSPRLEPEHLEPPAVTGGYLLKADRLDPGDSGLSAGGGTFALVDPKERILKSAARRPQLLYLTSYLNAFSKALSSPGFRDPMLGYRPYLEVPHWIDYHIVEVLSGNVDALVLSAYFYKPRDGPLAYGVHWDFDRALGSTDGRDANPRQWQTGPFFTGPWWNRLCADANFWQAWVDRYQDLRQGPLHRSHLHGLIDRLSDAVRQAQVRDRKRWNVNLRGGSYASEIQLMKNWVSNRLDFIDRQLAQPPRLLVPGGRITPGSTVALEPPAGPLTNTAAAVIYYTLDGSDPRGFTNAISPNARRYSGPIPVTQTVRLVARSWDSGRRQTGGPPSTTPWSQPVTATYTVASPALALGEIHAQPRVPADSPFPDTAFEFVELVNQGTGPLELPGCRFTLGVEFRFSRNDTVTRLEPGQRVVVAANPDALRWAYPELTGIVGPWTGRLANEGERLTVVGPLEEVLVDYSYDPSRQPLAAGGGFSLVLREELAASLDPEDPSHWRTSAQIGGSPGAPDPIPALRPPVVVNEVRSRSAGAGDLIELHNPSPTTAADLSYWWLSDDFAAPAGYRLPAGTVLAPGGFLVIPESEFRSGAPTGLDLDGIRGDAVWLFSADPEGTLTGYAHGFEFGAAETGSSFGRVLTTDGREHVAPMTSPTFAGPNAAPNPGPVVVSEVCPGTPGSNASDAAWEGFVELWNTSPTPVSLFDARSPGRTWRVRGGLEFELPPEVTLAPDERLCLVGFDPDRSPWALARFNARYLPPLAGRILGPARGRLDWGEGVVRLERPDPEEDVWLEVDTLHYHGDGSWPALPSATGHSLARSSPDGYGNEPRHWTAGPASAGDADTDLDGLPDQWEVAMGLDPRSGLGRDGATEDADGDGYSNHDEWLAGTSPRSAESRLEWSAARGADGRVVVSVQSAPDREYTVLFNDRLGSGTWQVLATDTAPPDGGLLQFVDPSFVRSNRFYRLRLP